MKKARMRMELRIKNLIEEMHNKLCIFLCKNFDMILIPNFRTKEMVGELKSKTARNMQTMSHYTFKEKLKVKGKEYGTIVIEVNEAFTSRTCGKCGNINKKSKSKDYKCKKCKVQIDRDLN